MRNVNALRGRSGKIICVAAAVLLLVSGCSESELRGAGRDTAISAMSSQIIPVVTEKPTAEPELSPVPSPEPIIRVEENLNETATVEAAHAGLYRAEDMTALMQKGAFERIAPASLTKVVTACTALQYVSPDEIFTVGSEQEMVQPNSSLCMIKPGHQLTMHQLLMGMFLPSGNDAAYTIAVNVARRVSGNGSLSDREAVDYFCGLMNQFAQKIGAVDSHFANPEGWDNEETYSTVYDLALFATYAMKIEEIRTIAATCEEYVVFVSGQNITWKNFNFLIDPSSPYYCPQAIGLKTGSTKNAGRCLLAAIEGNDGLYIAVVMGCPDDDSRFREVWHLIDMIEI